MTRQASVQFTTSSDHSCSSVGWDKERHCGGPARAIGDNKTFSIFGKVAASAGPPLKLRTLVPPYVNNSTGLFNNAEVDVNLQSRRRGMTGVDFDFPEGLVDRIVMHSDGRVWKNFNRERDFYRRLS